jgi:hypothetical protein
MTGKTSQCARLGVAKCVWGSRCGPVAMVRMQKAGIKYAKPMLQELAEHDLSVRSVGRKGLTQVAVKRSPGDWWGGGRTYTLALRVGGRLFPGKSVRTDRRLSHSRIFFPRAESFVCALAVGSSVAFGCEHRSVRDECQRIAIEGHSVAYTTNAPWTREMASQAISELSIYFLAYRDPGGGQIFGRRGPDR